MGMNNNNMGMNNNNMGMNNNNMGMNNNNMGMNNNNMGMNNNNMGMNNNNMASNFDNSNGFNNTFPNSFGGMPNNSFPQNNSFNMTNQFQSSQPSFPQPTMSDAGMNNNPSQPLSQPLSNNFPTNQTMMNSETNSFNNTFPQSTNIPNHNPPSNNSVPPSHTNNQTDLSALDKALMPIKETPKEINVPMTKTEDGASEYELPDDIDELKRIILYLQRGVEEQNLVIAEQQITIKKLHQQLGINPS
jgi:hypothetical protein